MLAFSPSSSSSPSSIRPPQELQGRERGSATTRGREGEDGRPHQGTKEGEKIIEVVSHEGTLTPSFIFLGLGKLGNLITIKFPQFP